MKAHFISSATVGLFVGMSSSAMAACAFAPDNYKGHWKKDGMNEQHFIMNDSDKCFLNLKNSKQGFAVTDIYYDKEPKHGEVHEFFPSPHDGGNALTYVPKPGFKGEETLIVTFKTTLNGEPFDTLRTKWRITVE